MRVLVTGGSGAVGQKVLERLCEDSSCDVTVFDLRTPRSVKRYRSLPRAVNVVYGDLTRKDEVESVCHEMDWVIHLAAMIPPLADRHPARAHAVNVTGTRNIISGLEKYSKNVFLLYTSSISVYGDRLDRPFIKTSDPLVPSEGDEYAKTKIEAEQLIGKSCLDWCIFRLTAVMGIDNHRVSSLMFHMPLKTPIEMVTPDDVSNALVKAIGHREVLSGKTFNLGGGELCRISYQQLLEQSFSLYGLGPLDFPDHAFAEKNFHCGYYADGDALNEILDFRRDTIESYFHRVKRSIPYWKKGATSVLRKIIKQQLLKSSEPFQAYQEGDRVRMLRFFEDADPQTSDENTSGHPG